MLLVCNWFSKMNVFSSRQRFYSKLLQYDFLFPTKMAYASNCYRLHSNSAKICKCWPVNWRVLASNVEREEKKQRNIQHNVWWYCHDICLCHYSAFHNLWFVFHSKMFHRKKICSVLLTTELVLLAVCFLLNTVSVAFDAGFPWYSLMNTVIDRCPQFSNLCSAVCLALELTRIPPVELTSILTLFGSSSCTHGVHVLVLRLFIPCLISEEKDSDLMTCFNLVCHRIVSRFNCHNYIFINYTVNT